MVYAHETLIWPVLRGTKRVEELESDVFKIQANSQAALKELPAETKRKKQQRIVSVQKAQTKKPLSHQGNDLEL